MKFLSTPRRGNHAKIHFFASRRNGKGGRNQEIGCGRRSRVRGGSAHGGREVSRIRPIPRGVSFPCPRGFSSTGDPNPSWTRGEMSPHAAEGGAARPPRRLHHLYNNHRKLPFLFHWIFVKIM